MPCSCGDCGPCRDANNGIDGIQGNETPENDSAHHDLPLQLSITSSFVEELLSQYASPITASMGSATPYALSQTVPQGRTYVPSRSSSSTPSIFHSRSSSSSSSSSSMNCECLPECGIIVPAGVIACAETKTNKCKIPDGCCPEVLADRVTRKNFNVIPHTQGCILEFDFKWEVDFCPGKKCTMGGACPCVNMSFVQFCRGERILNLYNFDNCREELVMRNQHDWLLDYPEPQKRLNRITYTSIAKICKDDPCPIPNIYLPDKPNLPLTTYAFGGKRWVPVSGGGTAYFESHLAAQCEDCKDPDAKCTWYSVRQLKWQINWEFFAKVTKCNQQFLTCDDYINTSTAQIGNSTPGDCVLIEKLGKLCEQPNCNDAIRDRSKWKPI
jgi:hypothetical protein